jgi:hypothetical protein
MNAPGFASPQRRQNGFDLMGERGHHDEIVGRLLVQRFGDARRGPFACSGYDALIALQLSESVGTWPGDDRHVMIGARELIREGAANLSGADDGDRQRR